MSRRTHDPRLVEIAVRRWLAETGVGTDLVRDQGLDAAVDAVFELLNAGFLKLTGSTRNITGITPTDRPHLPASPFVRHGNGEADR